MPEHPTFGDLLLGYEGLAILRAWGLEPETVRARAESIGEIVERGGEPPFANPMAEREATVGDGYREWAPDYDGPGNPVFLAEEPVVREMLDGIPAGEALDAACGTGRYARHLAALGFPVTGIDATPAMLELARRKVPAGRFEPGDLAALPVPSASFDLAICALALTHCADLSRAVGELARVTRPGGRIIISDVHPFSVALGLHARYPRAQGEAGFVQNHTHLPSDYLTAFREADLTVVQCREPLWGEAEIAAFGHSDERPGLLEAALEGLPLAIVWELEKQR